MKIALSILGVLMILAGVVWILQGFNVLLGSMMSGHMEYAILGLVVGVIGVGLLIYANRRPRGTSR
jgi:hypothetical protein